MSTPYIKWLDEINFPVDDSHADQTTGVTDSHFITPLTDYALIRVKGADAERFMQGQFSCDISEVTPNKSRLGTANTPKGRAYALFRVAKCNDDYLIRLPSALAPDFMSRLNKYIVFFKAELSLEEQLFPLGVVGQQAALMVAEQLAPLPTSVDDVEFLEDNLIIKVPGSDTPRYEIWSTPSTALSLLTWQKEQNSHTQTRYSQADWYWFELMEGIAEVLPETQESFIAQMLNVQHLNAVSFTKGCYTGQEIIARMKYLGKLKKNMFLLTTTPAITVLPGDTIWSSDRSKKSGTVVRSISKTSCTLTLAVLDAGSAKSGDTFALHHEGDDATTLLSLPYESAE